MYTQGNCGTSGLAPTNKLKTYRCAEEGLSNMSSSDHQTKTQLMEESLQNEDELTGKVGT